MGDLIADLAWGPYLVWGPFMVFFGYRMVKDIRSLLATRRRNAYYRGQWFLDVASASEAVGFRKIMPTHAEGEPSEAQHPRPGESWAREGRAATITVTTVPPAADAPPHQRVPRIRLFGRPKPRRPTEAPWAADDATSIPSSGLLSVRQSVLDLLLGRLPRDPTSGPIITASGSHHVIEFMLSEPGPFGSLADWIDTTLEAMASEPLLAARLRAVALDNEAPPDVRAIAAAYAALALSDDAQLATLAEDDDVPEAERALLRAALDPTPTGLREFATKPLVTPGPYTHASFVRQTRLRPVAIELLAARGQNDDASIASLLAADDGDVATFAVDLSARRGFADARRLLLDALRPGRPKVSSRIAALALREGDALFVPPITALIEAGECTEDYLRLLQRHGDASCVGPLGEVIRRLPASSNLRYTAELTLEQIRERLGPARKGALSLVGSSSGGGDLSLMDER